MFLTVSPRGGRGGGKKGTRYSHQRGGGELPTETYSLPLSKEKGEPFLWRGRKPFSQQEKKKEGKFFLGGKGSFF